MDANTTTIDTERFEYMQEYTQIYDFPGKSKSTVWKDFGFYKSPDTGCLDKTSAVCKICCALVKYCGNTTNLHTHLAKHRPKQYSNARAIKYDEVVMSIDEASFNREGSAGSSRSPPSSETVTATITCGSPPATTFPTVQTILMNSNHVQSLNNSLAQYLIANLLPPSVVDNTAFRNLMRVADQGYNMPPSQYFSESLIPQCYNETKQNIQGLLSNTENVTISTDVWTSNHTETEFVTLVVHMIDCNWEPHSFTLFTLEMDDDSDRMSTTLQSKLQHWRVPAAPVMVSNSDARIKSATDILGVRNISCLGNAISMAANDVLTSSGVPNTIEHCRSFVKALNRNGRDKTRFRKMQPETDDIELDSTGKWTTTFDMLLKICKKNETIQSIKQSDAFTTDTKSHVPNSEQIDKVKTIKNVLRPLRTAAKLLSDQGPSTASMILPVLRKLELTLAVKDEDQDYSTQLKRRVLDVLTSLYQDSNVRECLLVSSILDPRYKDLNFVDSAERKQGRAELADEATVLFRKSKGEHHVDLTVCHIKQEPGSENSCVAASNGSSVSIAAKDTSSAKRPRIEQDVGDDDDWLADVVSVKTEPKKSKTTLEETVLAEIDRYVSTEQTTTLPLQWWKNREAMYPILSRLVKKYMCITATNEQYDMTVSSDLQQKAWFNMRAMLPRDSVDKMVFLNKNFFKF
ncbi:zinc finger BED domain-containing protein 1-like [Mizuhopecten yessoensis]|uniref:zinc finger BED domain-containing protein 1-like n=1 Tax=Mizuhopecten yessoensis TaxID=6573 RepID=UPI000B45C493|nr:zinc finger BED domain-containing protein 1-like [Mizuhopecten yessoensis]